MSSNWYFFFPGWGCHPDITGFYWENSVDTEATLTFLKGTWQLIRDFLDALLETSKDLTIICGLRGAPLFHLGWEG